MCEALGDPVFQFNRRATVSVIVCIRVHMCVRFFVSLQAVFVCVLLCAVCVLVVLTHVLTLQSQSSKHLIHISFKHNDV